jgi:hypothetical protein
MKKYKLSKIISGAVFGLGVTAVVMLVLMALIGGDAQPNSDAMITFSYKEIASLWLAFGAIPMIAACIFVYRLNNIRHSANRKLKTLLVFLPSVLPVICALFWGGALLIGYINMFTNWGK